VAARVPVYREVWNRLFERWAEVGPDAAAGVDPALLVRTTIHLEARDDATASAADRYAEAMRSAEEIPPPLVRVVVDVPPGGRAPPGGGIATPPTRDPCDALLTLPANAEQERIVERLECEGAVVVQGPPGTGKTHTIANLIGHLLARGNTILVTAATPKALRVVRDKVVPDLQPLCVSYLDSDLRGREQLESSVNGIVRGLSESDPRALERQWVELARHRNSLQGQLDEIDHRLEKAQQAERTPIVVAGRQFSVRAAAEATAAGDGRDDWIPHPVDADVALPLAAAELLELYRLQASLSPADEAAVSCALPDSTTLPAPQHLRAVAKELRALAGATPEGTAAFFVKLPETSDRLAALVDAGTACRDWLAGDGALRRCVLDTLAGTVAASPWRELLQLVRDVREAAVAARAERLRHAITGVENLSTQHLFALRAMIERARAGGGFGPLALIGKKDWRDILNGVAVDGVSPAKETQLTAVEALLRERLLGSELSARWELHVVAGGGVALPEAPDQREAVLRHFESDLARALDFWQVEREPLLAALESEGLAARRVLAQLEASSPEPLTALDRFCGECLRPALAILHATFRRATLQAWLAKAGVPLGQSATRGIGAQLALHFRNLKVDEYERTWAELRRLEAVRAVAHRRASLLGKLETAAPAWAEALRARQQPHSGPAVPGDAEAAWLHAQLRQELQRPSAADVDPLRRQAAELRESLRRATNDLVRTGAWLHQHRRTSPAGRRALNGWVDFQKQIGKGTGNRASRLRRRAQEILAACREVVPVWVMPVSRVRDSFDPATTRFDVVIVDEASQCDVEGLFPLALARRLVVVGDDQQVSPLAVGEQTERIDRLIDTHLAGVPHADLYTGKLSLYDLAKQSSPAIRLREHFRCLPEIIVFSSWLSYEGEIRPLRDGHSAPLGSAVVEHCVRDGVCDGNNVNIREAAEVAALVRGCCEQPEYARMTMGVISLLGDRQWDLIQRLLMDLDARQAEERRLLCGSAGHFQGDERDVVFLSVVASSDDGPQRLREDQEFKKRINVASSRAQNQMWVVHSLNPETDLKEGDLRLRLLQHARHPHALVRCGLSEARTESEFERRVLKMLQARGYRVHPQWDVGAYRIDLVVDGADGRRVALECDGEKWHSTDEALARDRRRQQQLERLGWTFLRLRGSRFFRHPEGTIDALCSQLSDRGIGPLGAEPVPDAPGRDELRERVLRAAGEWRDKLVDLALRSVAPARRRRACERGMAAPPAAGAAATDASRTVAKSQAAGPDAGPTAAPPTEAPLPRPAPQDAQVASAEPSVPSTATDSVCGPTDAGPHGASVAQGRASGAGRVAGARDVEAGAPPRIDRGGAIRAAPGVRLAYPLAAAASRVLSPICSRCGGEAALLIDKSGLRLACVDITCAAKEVPFLPRLQELADSVGASCYSCGGALSVRQAPFGVYLKCQKCASNNSWEGINRRMMERRGA